MCGFTFSSYYSLALYYFSFGLGFSYDTRPFCSVKSAVPHHFTPTFLKSNSTSSIHLLLVLSFILLLLVCLRGTYLLFFHGPFLQNRQAISI